MSAAVLSCIGVLPACGEGPAYQVADSAGVRIVTNSGQDHPLNWAADTLFVLGGKDSGPELFHNVDRSTVATDSRGTIYVWDESNHRLVVFDRDGRFLWNAGREGGGPGEVRAGNSLAVDGEGTAYIYDWGKSALAAFGEGGAVLPQIPFPHPPIRARQAHFVPNRGGFTFWRREQFDGSDRRKIELLRVQDADTAVLLSAYPRLSSTARFDPCPLTLTLPVLFAPSLNWHAAGEDVALNVAPEYAIEIFRAGVKRLSVRRDVEPIEITEAEALAEYSERAKLGPIAGCSPSPRDMLKEIGYESRLQPIMDLILSPDGEIWVKRRLGRGEQSRIDIFTPEGIYAGTLPPDFPFPVVVFPDGQIGAQLKDELDVERLAVVRVLRGTQTSDAQQRGKRP